MQQHLQLQPMEGHQQDQTAAAAAATAAATAAAAGSVSHLASSQQMQRRQLARGPQAQESHHQQQHQFQIHQMQQSHHRHQSHPQQQSRTQHRQSATNQAQHQLSSMHIPQNTSQLGSLGLTTASPGSSFPSTSNITQSATHFAQNIQRDHQQQQQSQFPLQASGNISQQGMAAQQAASSASFGNVQPLLPNQQPSSFGSLANLPGSMLPGGVVDEPGGTQQQFTNSQSGDALGTAYPWDPSHPQGALSSQNLAGNQSQQHQMLPLPLVGDTRANTSLNNNGSSTNFNSQNNATQNSFGALNNGMGVLGSSLNTAMVGGLVNGNSLGANVAPSLSPSGTEPSQRNSYSVSEGVSRNAKTSKKAKSTGVRKAAPNRARNSRTVQAARGPVTSPVSTTALPNQQHQPPPPTQSIPTVVPNRAVRPTRGGKVKGRTRVSNQEPAKQAVVNVATSIAGGPQTAPREDPAPGATAGTAPAAALPATGTFASANKNMIGTMSPWPGKKTASRSRSRRKAGDGRNSTPVPVHLRNPKKGRARVFRECKQCRSENHIRRSDCASCKAPLPAGKRRRDGTISYSKSSTSRGVQVPNTCVVGQSVVGSSRQGVKDEITVPSVVGK